MGSRKLGSRTTAEEAIGDTSLEGKIAIVTGASSGIGIETARVLAARGANVVMGCRSVASGENACANLRTSLPSAAGTLEVLELDLTDLASVRAFAEAVQARQALHLLVNNAGVMATPLGVTKQGMELQLGTNHVGHFFLTKLLRPLLEASGPARIVNVSSALHKRGVPERLVQTLDGDPTYTKRRSYTPFDAYGDSKLANVLFTKQLAKILPPAVHAFALHPGVIATNLTRSMGVAGSIFRAVGKVFTKTVPQGAATSIYAATAPELEGQSGAYLADCAVVSASRAGRDEVLAAKVWTLSESLVATA
jgi:NAD(P)-dependent dehydrogenase (short-subunit alcohol dehydrogenase family)